MEIQSEKFVPPPQETTIKLTLTLTEKEAYWLRTLVDPNNHPVEFSKARNTAALTVGVPIRNELWRYGIQDDYKQRL